MSPTVPSTTASRTQVALAVLRVGVAALFFVHGYQKLFQLHLSGVTAFFTKLGIPLPAMSAIFVIAVEFVGPMLMRWDYSPGSWPSFA